MLKYLKNVLKEMLFVTTFFGVRTLAKVPSLIKNVTLTTLKSVFRFIGRGFISFYESFWDAVRVMMTVGIIALFAFPIVKFALQNLDKLPAPNRSVYRVENLPSLKLSEMFSDPNSFNHSALIRLHNHKDQFFCSGFVISKSYAITAAHCVDDNFNPHFDKDQIHVWNDKVQNTSRSVKTVFFDSQLDLALLVGDFTGFNTLPIVLAPHEIFNMDAPSNGELLTCGFPYGDKKLCVPYFMAGSMDFLLSGKSFYYQGMSGGPVINPVSGKVIAVNSRVNGPMALSAPIIGLFNNAHVKIEE